MSNTNPLDSLWAQGTPTPAPAPSPVVAAPAAAPETASMNPLTKPAVSETPKSTAANPLDGIWSKPSTSAPVADNPLDKIWSKPVVAPLSTTTPTTATAPVTDAPPADDTSTWEKIKNFANHPIVSTVLGLMPGTPEEKKLVETAVGPGGVSALVGYGLQKLAANHPTLAKIASVYSGSQQAVADTAAGMTSPTNAAVMAVTGGLGAMEGVAGPVVARLVNAGFSLQGLYQAYNNVPEIRTALQKGDIETAAKLMTATAGTVGMSAMAGLHALGEVNPASETAKGKNAVEPLRNAPVAKIVESEAQKIESERAQAQQPFTGTKPEAEALADKINAKIVGSTATGAKVPNDLDLRVEGDYDKKAIESALAQHGLEARGSSVVSPEEAKDSGKSYGTPGWKRVEHFENATGQKIDVWHDEPDTEAPPVDEPKPLRLFHGTSGDLTDVSEMRPEEFGKPGSLGIGAYFSGKPDVAGQYAGPADVATGGRVIAGELQPGVKLLDADAPLPEKLQADLKRKFGDQGDTYKDFVKSANENKYDFTDLQKIVATEGYKGVKAEDVHGSPGTMLFGEDVTGTPLKDVIKPTLPTAKVVPDDYTPVVSKDEILSEASQRIVNNSPILKQILDPAKINSAADIKTALDDAASHIQQNLDPRVGARISFDAQKQLAQDLNMPIEQLLDRKSGTAFNAETAIASRAMLQSSASDVLDLAKKAASGDATAREQLPYAVAKHQEIISQIAGVASEAGRALGSFNIKDADLPAIKIAKVMAQLSPDALDEASKLLSKIDPNNLRKVNEFVKQITPATTADKLFEGYRNNLLSSPATVIKKIASESAMMALETTKKALVGGLEKLKSATGVSEKPDAVASEAYWYAKGAAQALTHTKQIMTGEFNLADAPGFEHGGEHSIKGTLGKIIRFPSELIGRQTNVVYAMNYFGELNALAARQAISEGLSGEDLASRQEYLAQKPTPEMTTAANEMALHNTFQNKLGKFGAASSNAIQSNALTRFLFPFFKTPVNLVKASGEYSPYGVLKGTATGDLNLQARGLIGSSIAAGIAYLVSQGVITGGGPVNFKQREVKEATGWQPYSVKIGDRYYSYHKAEPLGLTLALVADTVHSSMHDEAVVTKSKAENALDHITRNVEDFPFLMQISSLVDSLTHLGEGHTPERVVDNMLASSVVPAGIKGIAQTADTTVRSPQHEGLLSNPVPGIAQTLEERIPGLTKNVPADIDISGQPVQRPVSGLGGLNPFPVTTDKKNAAIAELARLGITVENAPTKPFTHRGTDGKQHPYPGSIGTPSDDEAAKIQQQETEAVYNYAARAVANPGWERLPDSEKKKVIAGIRKLVDRDRLHRLQQIRTGG